MASEATLEGLFYYTQYFCFAVTVILAILYVSKWGKEIVINNEYSTLRTFLSIILGLLLFPMMVISVILIWGDNQGGGNIFTYDAMIQLFRTKSNMYLLGIWMEVLLFQTMVALFVIYDGLINDLHISIIIISILLAIISGSFGLIFYLTARQITLWIRKRREETVQYADS